MSTAGFLMRIPPLDKNFKFAVERAHIFDDLRLDELGNFLRFSWREINPTIFGAMFEALFNEETRRSEGIHYTSIENYRPAVFRRLERGACRRQTYAEEKSRRRTQSLSR